MVNQRHSTQNEPFIEKKKCCPHVPPAAVVPIAPPAIDPPSYATNHSHKGAHHAPRNIPANVLAVPPCYTTCDTTNSNSLFS